METSCQQLFSIVDCLLTSLGATQMLISGRDNYLRVAVPPQRDLPAPLPYLCGGILAGDWIKLEHATLDKPEVARLADLLGITPDAALGLLFRFWVWLDRNSCNGHVTHVYARPLEIIMHCPGFVAAMADIGWLSVDENTGILTIPNPDRHSFEAAKSRALTRDRVKRSRNVNVTPTPLPEKRREEVVPSASGLSDPQRPSPLNGKPVRLRATRLPPDWRLPDEYKDYATKIHHLEPDRTVRISLAFRDYWIAKPGSAGTKLDWFATWRNWIRKETHDA